MKRIQKKEYRDRHNNKKGKKKTGCGNFPGEKRKGKTRNAEGDRDLPTEVQSPLR